MQAQYTPEPIPTKYCPKCKEWKPATIEHFARNRRTKSGFDCHCKACKRAYYLANRERMLKKAKANYVANRTHRLALARAYRSANRNKIIEYKKSYQVLNRERLRAISRKRYSAHKEEHLEKSRSWRIANKERKAELDRAYRQANPEVRRANKNRRRALELEAPGSHTAADIKRQYKAQRGKCYYCGRKVGKKYHIDHVVPLTRGGSDDVSNLVISCPSCNLSKHDKLPHEWPQGNRLL